MSESLSARQPPRLNQVRAAVRTIQELLGYEDLNNTMIPTHVTNKGGLGVRSRADRLRGWGCPHKKC